jgi:hypothetical protein
MRMRRQMAGGTSVAMSSRSSLLLMSSYAGMDGSLAGKVRTENSEPRSANPSLGPE